MQNEWRSINVCHLDAILSLTLESFFLLTKPWLILGKAGRGLSKEYSQQTSGRATGERRGRKTSRTDTNVSIAFPAWKLIKKHRFQPLLFLRSIGLSAPGNSAAKNLSKSSHGLQHRVKFLNVAYKVYYINLIFDHE